MTPGAYFNVGSTDACAPYTSTVAHRDHSLGPAQRCFQTFERFKALRPILHRPHQ